MTYLTAGWHEPHSLDARELPDDPIVRPGVRSVQTIPPPREIDHLDAEIDEGYLDEEADVPEGEVAAEGDAAVDAEAEPGKRRTRRKETEPSW